MPPDYLFELKKLQDSAAPVPFGDIWEALLAELGQPSENIFSHFEHEPLASASIGQAHAALLHDGTQVVVKIRRPGVVEQVNVSCLRSAPTIPLWMVMGILYTLLLAAFRVGHLDVVGQLASIARCRIVEAVFGIFWPPMHQRGSEFTLTDTSWKSCPNYDAWDPPYAEARLLGLLWTTPSGISPHQYAG